MPFFKLLRHIIDTEGWQVRAHFFFLAAPNESQKLHQLHEQH
jgi:hypothetical protein